MTTITITKNLDSFWGAINILAAYPDDPAAAHAAIIEMLQEDTTELLDGATWEIVPDKPTTVVATTIPPDQIRNAGEPVFSELRKRIRGSVRLNRLIDEREAVGLAKYHQPLMTDDSRDTHTEILGEVGDLLAYVTKLAMQRQTPAAWALVDASIVFVEDLMVAVEEIESEVQL